MAICPNTGQLCENTNCDPPKVCAHHVKPLAGPKPDLMLNLALIPDASLIRLADSIDYAIRHMGVSADCHNHLTAVHSHLRNWLGHKGVSI